MWPALTILAAIAAVALHFWWRRRFLRAESAARANADALNAQLEEQALDVQTQQQALFNSMVEGVLLLGENDRIQLANRAFLNLFSVPGNVRGRTVLEVVRHHELDELMKRVAAERQVLGFELNQSGLVERCLEVNAATLSDAAGSQRGTILVFHDLTRLKQLERTREEFVANVSHELRTPLSLIKGYTETLLDGAKDNPEVASRFLQTIQRNSERLQFLIEDLLTISELESGRVTMNVQRIQLRSAVEKVLEDLRTQARGRKVTLVNEVPEIPARADSDRLQQVLNNLVGNAVKYGRSEGTVSVRARSMENGVEVCVQDDGPGIPPDAIERVFERFFRVDKARSREQGGTGLGLSIVKHIIQNHGGKVWATSESGKGAAFYFTLPNEKESDLKP